MNRDDDIDDLDLTQDLLFRQIQAIEEEEEEDVALAAAGIVIYLDHEIRRIHGARRARTRQYLVRAELLPNPRVDTPWQVLYHHQNARGFITTMGFNPETFQMILDAGFENLWNSTPISRSDTTPTTPSRTNSRSLDAAGALGLLLHYLSSTMQEVTLCNIFALIPVTVYRYITFGLPLLHETLRQMPEAKVRYPSGIEFEEQNALVLVRILYSQELMFYTQWRLV